MARIINVLYLRWLVLPLCLLSVLPRAYAAGEFAGAWVGKLCSTEASSQGSECGHFVLELMERDGKLCGAHMAATAAADQIDEGAAPSLTADIDARVATGTVVARLDERQPVRVGVELQIKGAALLWKQLEKPGGKTLLPAEAQLLKSRKPTLFAPLFARELQAACNYIFSMAEIEREKSIPGMHGQGADLSGQARR